MLSSFGAEQAKQRLRNASRNLYDCVYLFVSSTNIMFRMLNQYLQTEFPNVVVRENLGIKENLQLLVSALKDMQETVELKDKEIQQCDSATLYSKIFQPAVSVNEKVTLLKEISCLYKDSFASVCGPVAMVLMKNSNLPEKLQSALRLLVNSPVMALRVGDLLMTHDELAGALPETSTSSSSSPVPAEKPRSKSVTYSITTFIQMVVRDQKPKNNLQIAADYLEEAIKVLKPACEHFQSVAKRAEEYISLAVTKLQ